MWSRSSITERCFPCFHIETVKLCLLLCTNRAFSLTCHVSFAIMLTVKTCWCSAHKFNYRQSFLQFIPKVKVPWQSIQTFWDKETQMSMSCFSSGDHQTFAAWGPYMCISYQNEPLTQILRKMYNVKWHTYSLIKCSPSDWIKTFILQAFFSLYRHIFSPPLSHKALTGGEPTVLVCRVSPATQCLKMFLDSYFSMQLFLKKQNILTMISLWNKYSSQTSLFDSALWHFGQENTHSVSYYPSGFYGAPMECDSVITETRED